MAKTSRFRELQNHSLRLSDVAGVKATADEFSKRLAAEPRYGKPLRTIIGNLGDPIAYGFKQPPRFQEKVVEGAKQESPYTDSVGLPALLDELSYGGIRVAENPPGNKRVMASYRLERGKDASIFVGPGSSGVVRAYTQVVCGGKKNKAVFFIPELTYPLFLAEAANAEADIVTVPLDKRTGLVDMGQLEKTMNRVIKRYDTGPRMKYMFAATTIGNPLGSSMDLATFDEITWLLKDIHRKFNTRMHRITDPTYEPFRRDQRSRFDPVERILQKGSEAFELITGTFSKSQGLTGERLGYGTLIGNREGIFDEVGIYHAITLCTVGVRNQIALAEWLRDIRTSVPAFEEEQMRQNDMRATVNGRVEHFAKAIASMDEAWLHSFYYPEGKECGLNLDRLNSFYVLWRFRFDRQPEASQAAMFAKWTLSRALDEIAKTGEQTTPVVFMSDGDMFFAKTFRGKVPQYIRTVALMDKEQMDSVLNLIREYGAAVNSHNRPVEHAEPVYPFELAA
ncbi:MAG: aminotransferase class I/II-fold pyridoxal phosphate-dependent enzyme [Candidatus Micrarchaeota archaeon]